MDFQTLGDWCKWLEKNFSPEQMIPTLPVIIRLDGCNFHTWTKGLERPFDANLCALMDDLTSFLVDETNAIIGYTQSDEITLVLYSPVRDKQVYHGGRKQKILSKLSGIASDFFNTRRPHYLPNHNKRAIFDCRIYQVPTLQDAVAQLLWRENDASKNSVSMLAQSHFSHNSLQNLNGSQMQDKLMEIGINWNDLSARYKRGAYFKRTKISTPYTDIELDKLPLLHNARRNPDLVIERHVTTRVEYPIMSKITNPIDVIFGGLEPKLNTE